MVVHQDKWKLKATRRYHQRHPGTAPTPRVGSANVAQAEEATLHLSDASRSDTEGSQDRDTNATDAEKEEAASRYRSRPVRSNAWRYTTEPLSEAAEAERAEEEAALRGLHTLPARPAFEEQKESSMKTRYAGPLDHQTRKIESVGAAEYAELQADIARADLRRQMVHKFRRGPRYGSYDEHDGGDAELDDLLGVEEGAGLESERPAPGRHTPGQRVPPNLRTADEDFLDSLLERG